MKKQQELLALQKQEEEEAKAAELAAQDEATRALISEKQDQIE